MWYVDRMYDRSPRQEARYLEALSRPRRRLSAKTPWTASEKAEAWGWAAGVFVLVLILNAIGVLP